MEKTYMKPAISVIVVGYKENLLAGSLGLTSEGGSAPLINYEYDGNALSRSNVNLWEDE